MAENARAFVAVAVAPAAVEEIRKFQAALREKIPSKDVRWMHPGQFHVTMKFLGDIVRDRLGELEFAVQRGCKGIAPFTLRLDGAGCFPDAIRPRVMWVGIGGALDSLKKLHAQIDNETTGYGDHEEAREFHPHLTIGRVKAQGAGARQVREAMDATALGAAPEWKVKEVVLMQSQLSAEGSVYSPLATVRLE